MLRINCISLNKNIQTDILKSFSEWPCEPCIVSIFPSIISKKTERLLSNPDLISNPFYFNDPALSSPLGDIDPDVNFDNNINVQVYTHCNHHNESTLNGEIRKK